MSKSVAPFGNKILARHIFDDSRLSSEAHSDDEYDTPMKEHERVTIKRQRDKSDEGGKSPLIKKSRGTKSVKSRSICKSSPGEKSKPQSKMFKSFQKGESSDEEEPQNFSFGNTPKKSSSKKSFGQPTKTSSTRNPLMENWLKKSSLKEVHDNFNCDSENIDANKSIDTSKISNQWIKNETKNVQNSSLKKKSSVFSDVADVVENYHGNSSDEDIKQVDEMSLEPLDNSSAEIPTEKKSYLQTYKIPRLTKNEVSKNKGELNFDRQLKNKERKGLHDSSSEKPILIPIVKNGSNNSTSSVEILSDTNVEATGENGFKFPERFKHSSKSKSSGKKTKTGSEVFDGNTGETEEEGSKPRKETAKKKRSVKGKGKESNRASNVFDDSDDPEVPKKNESGSSVFENEDDDIKVQKTGSSIFDYDDPPDVLKLIDRDTGFKKHARRRQSMAKMAKRSNCSMVKGVRSESTESEEEPSKKPVKRKPRRKKEEADEKDKKKQKNINQYFQSSSEMKAMKSKHNLISSPTKNGSDEDSDEELSDEYVPDLDELLKMPERPADGAKTKDEILDEMDKQIADRQKAHEQEMDKLDKDIEAEKRKRIDKKARMKENAKRRNLLETELNERKLRKLFKQNLEYLEGIWDGKVESSRHLAFHQSIRTRHALYYMMITDPFTDEQLDWTLDEIGKVWMNTKEEHRKHNEYVWKVILAECFIKFYMDFFSVTKEDAVQMISETPLHKKDQLKDMKVSDESENSESNEDV